jgi:hypothetical protein
VTSSAAPAIASSASFEAVAGRERGGGYDEELELAAGGGE